MSLVEEMVQLFDAEGQRDISDELVAQIVDYFAARCASSPESATLHNNLAWAAARNGRLLDRALAHAQRAVELEPEAAGFLDTLAEVYFQRGDREEAIRYAERALALRPLGTSLMDQLDRFRSAPLPKP